MRVGKRQVDAQAVEQRDENRHHLPQQKDDDADGDGDDRDRIDHRRLHGALQFDVLFDVAREALQNGVENTARLARFHHVVVQRVEDLVVLLHGGGERRAALDRGAGAVQNLLEGFVLLLARKNLQALHQRQAGVDHHRELAREDGQLLGRDAAAAKRGDVEFLPLFGQLADVDLFAAQRGREFGLAGCGAFSRDGGTRLGWFRDM